jgi:hypothetical protein
MIWRYADGSSEPFYYMGDFNAISDLVDKFGGSSRMNSNNRSFRDLIQQAYLLDLGYKGPTYTWTNCQYTSNPIYQRLDRALVMTSW